MDTNMAGSSYVRWAQLDFEIKHLTGAHTTAASIDVFKCFDQIVRPLVYELARIAGMPTNILKTYEAFQQQLVIHNQVGNTLGKAHQHKCSIHQGCPYSMTFIALLMRPWILRMRELTLQPRVLADDLFLSASRDQHAQRATNGMQESRTYFGDIAAAVADKKCFMASTCAQTRRKLAQISWDDRGTRLKVVTNFRDLGAHTNLSRTTNTTTTTQSHHQSQAT